MRLSSPPHPIRHLDLSVHVSTGRSSASVFVGNRRAVDADRALVAHSATFPLPDEPRTLADVLDVLRIALAALEEHPDTFSA